MHTCKKCGCDAGNNPTWIQNDDGVYECLCSICMIDVRIKTIENILIELTHVLDSIDKFNREKYVKGE